MCGDCHAEQGRQLAHLRERRRSGGTQLLGGRGGCVAHHHHSRLDAGLDAGDAVLDDGRRRRLEAHPLGRVEEEVRRWLSARDVVDAEDRLVAKAVEQPAGVQPAPDALVVAAGGDAARQVRGVDRVQCIRDPGDRLEALVERREQPLAVPRAQVGPRRAAKARLDRREPVRPRATLEVAVDVVLRGRQAQVAQQLGEDRARERLAVDQHAVAVEDDGVDRRQVDGDGRHGSAARGQRPHGCGSPHAAGSSSSRATPSTRARRVQRSTAGTASTATGAVSRMNRSSAATTAAASSGEADGATIVN